MQRHYSAEVIENGTIRRVRFTSKANTRKGLIRKAERAMYNKYIHHIPVKFDDIRYRQDGEYKPMYHLVNLGWFQK